MEKRRATKKAVFTGFYFNRTCVTLKELVCWLYAWAFDWAFELQGLVIKIRHICIEFNLDIHGMDKMQHFKSKSKLRDTKILIVGSIIVEWITEFPSENLFLFSFQFFCTIISYSSQVLIIHYKQYRKTTQK